MDYARRARANPNFPEECDAALRAKTLDRKDALLCNEVQCLKARIATKFQLCLENCKDPGHLSFLRAIRRSMRVRADAYTAPRVLCQFTKTVTDSAVKVTVADEVSFVCDAMYFNTNLSRAVEYFYFVERCVEFPFADPAEAALVFANAEAVIESLTKLQS